VELYYLVIGLLLTNTYLLASKPNEIIIYEEKEVYPTKSYVFLQCLESRKQYSDVFDTDGKSDSNNNDIDDCKKAALELTE
jgi:hypothetical protein